MDLENKFQLESDSKMMAAEKKQQKLEREKWIIEAR